MSDGSRRLIDRIIIQQFKPSIRELLWKNRSTLC